MVILGEDFTEAYNFVLMDKVVEAYNFVLMCIVVIQVFVVDAIDAGAFVSTIYSVSETYSITSSFGIVSVFDKLI